MLNKGHLIRGQCNNFDKGLLCSSLPSCIIPCIIFLGIKNISAASVEVRCE